MLLLLTFCVEECLVNEEVQTDIIVKKYIVVIVNIYLYMCVK